MESKRRQQLGLAALAVLVVVGVYRFWPRTAGSTAGTSNQASSTSRSRGGAELQITAPDVHLEALTAERAKPEDVTRNLFRFKPKPPPPPPPRQEVPVRPPAPPVPTGPPPPPDIPLKFAGILQQGSIKIASLTDNLGTVILAKEGDVIEGRYRLLRIGVESIEIAYLDGRGRKTIRLSGT